jgi:O-antigen ligase
MNVLSLMRQDVLSRWAVIGFLVLLCGAWVLPSNKIYHQLIIVFLWLPALLALFKRDFRVVLFKPEVLLFIVFSLWTWFVLYMQGGNDPLSKSKLPIYVALTLLGVILAARDLRWTLEVQLGFAVLVGGFFSIISAVYFYWFVDNLDGRLIGFGLWDKAIMVAHAVGALAVIGVFVVDKSLRQFWLVSLTAVAAFGYVFFLGLNQTRGVWIALAATLVVMVSVLPTKKGFLFVLLVLVGVAGVAVFDSEILLQRGLSYRPDLWGGGVLLILDNWLLGLGFNHYEIMVPSLGVGFKHPHNLFLDTGVRLGIPGLLLFLLLWAATAWRAWSNRDKSLGRALLALWVFSSVALLTDGIGLWLKPNADWLITWLPIALAMVLASRESVSTAHLVKIPK